MLVVEHSVSGVARIVRNRGLNYAAGRLHKTLYDPRTPAMNVIAPKCISP
jgi:hypothetical protein